VAQNFIYRGAWGLGSIMGLLLDGAEGPHQIRALEIGDWPRSGLPWIAFWMKELITWGTLDPVAAFLLARGDAVDRPGAEAEARNYYEGLPQNVDPNDVLDPRQIRDWVGSRRVRREEAFPVTEFAIEAVLVRPAADYSMVRFSVTSIDVVDGLIWIDPAGYTVARSEKPHDWPEDPSNFEFELDVSQTRILGTAYLRHY
jgi:hypothetical protein